MHTWSPAVVTCSPHAGHGVGPFTRLRVGSFLAFTVRLTLVQYVVFVLPGGRPLPRLIGCMMFGGLEVAILSWKRRADFLCVWLVVCPV